MVSFGSKVKGGNNQTKVKRVFGSSCYTFDSLRGLVLGSENLTWSLHGFEWGFGVSFPSQFTSNKLVRSIPFGQISYNYIIILVSSPHKTTNKYVSQLQLQKLLLLNPLSHFHTWSKSMEHKLIRVFELLFFFEG